MSLERAGSGPVGMALASTVVIGASLAAAGGCSVERRAQNDVQTRHNGRISVIY